MFGWRSGWRGSLLVFLFVLVFDNVSCLDMQADVSWRLGACSAACHSVAYWVEALDYHPSIDSAALCESESYRLVDSEVH